MAYTSQKVEVVNVAICVNKRDLENNPLSALWIGKCTVYEYVDTVDETTHQTTQSLSAYITDEPCRLSYEYEQSTNIRSGAAVVSQSITLFIRPDIDIKAGSVIEITQHGKTIRYKGSSRPAYHTNHQEIKLDIYEENA